MAVALQMHMASILISYIECFLTLGFAGLLFAFTVVDDIKGDLNRFNEIAKHKRSQPNCMEKLTKLIRFHINLKELRFHRQNTNSKLITDH